MKAPRWDEVLFGSERAYRRPLTPKVSDESLFSLLLEMEDQLRPGRNGAPNPKQDPGGRKSSPKEEPKRLTRRNLSRYIE
jgi:hypothetical protein